MSRVLAESKPSAGCVNSRWAGLSAVLGRVTWTFAAYNLIRLGGIGQWWNPSPT